MLQLEGYASGPLCQANATGRKSFIGYEAEAVLRNQWTNLDWLVVLSYRHWAVGSQLICLEMFLLRVLHREPDCHSLLSRSNTS